jgi:hypothetical protein
MLGCVSQSSSNVKEAVLNPGESIRFKNQNGGGTITYVSPLKRKFVFDDGTEGTVRMIARKNRFLGKLGIYNPGQRWFYEGWKGARLVVLEAEMHFENLEEAQEYMFQGSKVMDWVHNSDGYVLGFAKSPQRNQINITLYRYMVNNQPLKNIPDYDNELVVLRDSAGVRVSR